MTGITWKMIIESILEQALKFLKAQADTILNLKKGGNQHV